MQYARHILAATNGAKCRTYIHGDTVASKADRAKPTSLLSKSNIV